MRVRNVWAQSFTLEPIAHCRGVWLGKLAGCGYCLGYWVALGLVAIYRPKLFEAWRLLDSVLTALVVAWLVAFQWAALCRLTEKAEE